jgi:hypothetical protein
MVSLIKNQISVQGIPGVEELRRNTNAKHLVLWNNCFWEAGLPEVNDCFRGSISGHHHKDEPGISG